MRQNTAVNVQTFINEHPFSGFQWLIFAMCFVVVLLDGFDTAAIGFIAPSLVTEWHISRPALAPVLSAALFGLACGALVSGPLSDRIGRRVLLLGSVTLFGVACFGLGVFRRYRAFDRPALRHRRRPRRRHAERGHPDE